MSKIKFYFILLIAAITTISCNKDDDNDIEIVPPKPYAEQYPKDIALIENYLKTNYITVVNAPGETKDQDVVITPIPSGGTQTPIYGYLNSSTFPKLTFREVALHGGVKYKLYYLILREGQGEKPCNVDDVLTSYNGKYLAEKTTDNVTAITSTQFEEVIYPQAFLNLYNVIRGWKEVFPQFKSGDAVSNPDGTIKYTNFGAGVMFIPSGLAYYNSAKSTIPAYSPLVFSFKLYKINRSDFEPDGVLSYQEDSNEDGYVWMNSELQDGVTVNPDDTDKDGTPDFIDFDDDGDNYATRGEVKDKDGNYYAFDLIPDCSGNIPTEREKKRHLDRTCIKMNQ